MITLKNVLLSLAIAPLAMSMAFAQSANDMKRQSMMQSQIQKPMAVQESRIIKRQDAKAMQSVMINEFPQHEEDVSRCNPPDDLISIDDIDGCVGIASDSTF